MNDFWKQFKHWQKKTGKYAVNEGRWHVLEVKAGASHIWHKMCSLPYYERLGHVACRTTSKQTGIGPAERALSALSHLKTDKRANLCGDKTEKQAILYTTALIADAKIKQNTMEKIDSMNKDDMWEDDDAK